MFSKLLRLLAITLAVILLAACSAGRAELLDGYYTAEMADFDDHGWKEFITIYVNGGSIVTVEYNAKNSSGLVKSWDTKYMRDMNSVCGIYPNEYARTYITSLLSKQNPSEIDAVTGATHSYETFKLLAEAVVERSRAGDKSVAFVEFPA